MESSAQGLSMGTLKHVVGHGVVGRAANAAMGGKFQDGFVSAASSAFVGDMGWNEGATRISRTIKAGIIGGTASALGGGKFANGAYTAAFQHLLNNESGQPRGAWTKEQEIAELAKDGIELNWFERLMFKHEAIGNGMERTANALGGLGDGVSMGGAEWISKQVYGDEAVWADKDSLMYQSGYWTGVAGSTIAGGAVGVNASFATKSGYFWGGAGTSARLAAAEASAIGAKTVGQTLGGRVATGIESYLLKKGWATKEQTYNYIWKPASTLFAKNTQSFGGLSGTGGHIWRTIEAPILRTRGLIH
jgi:hypothetical protein